MADERGPEQDGRPDPHQGSAQRPAGHRALGALPVPGGPPGALLAEHHPGPRGAGPGRRPPAVGPGRDAARPRPGRAGGQRHLHPRAAGLHGRRDQRPAGGDAQCRQLHRRAGQLRVLRAPRPHPALPDAHRPGGGQPGLRGDHRGGVRRGHRAQCGGDRRVGRERVHPARQPGVLGGAAADLRHPGRHRLPRAGRQRDPHRRGADRPERRGQRLRRDRADQLLPGPGEGPPGPGAELPGPGGDLPAPDLGPGR